MRKRNIIPPIIIIGMHRSGTSMISRMLEELGLFVGVKKQHDHESVFFININNWLLKQCGGSWDNPAPIHYLMQRRDVRELVVKYMKFIMKTPHAVSYLGWKNYLKYKTPANLDMPWGWKDPRNTFTLPLWLEILPDAKVIHIYRNGVDVANSLKVRETKGFQEKSHPVLNRYKSIAYIFRPKRGSFTDSVRCSSLDGGFTLWEEYISTAKKHVKELGQRALEIKYEEFIDHPLEALRCLLKFCEINASDVELKKVAGMVNKSRGNAYKNESKLRSYSTNVSERLCLYGY